MWNYETISVDTAEDFTKLQFILDKELVSYAIASDDSGSFAYSVILSAFPGRIRRVLRALDNVNVIYQTTYSEGEGA